MSETTVAESNSTMEVDENQPPAIQPTPAAKKTKNLPWIEKYRPETFIDIVGNEDVIENLESLIKNGNIPNILISGPPGVGKTTTILCFARALLGGHMKNGVLELNASNDRGIDVIRNKIKMFAQKKLNLPPGRHKLIILDEADSMTDQAQQALRRTMEIYSNTTRFALACNTSENIIEPIQSRCAVLRYGKLTDEEILAKVLDVCNKENLSYTDDGMEAILFTAQGDLRQALNNLQSTHNGFGHVNSKNVFKVCDEPHPSLIIKMVEYCTHGNFSNAFPILQYLWNLGFSGDDLIGLIFRICSTFSMNEILRLDYIREISEVQADVINGFTSFLQFNNLLARLCTRALKVNDN